MWRTVALFPFIYFLKFQYSACQKLKFQDSACQISKFQDSACQILKFQDSAFPPPLLLDQTEARRALKFFFENRPPLISGSGWLGPFFMWRSGLATDMNESVDEISYCDPSHESYWVVLSCGTVYYAVQGGSNFWVCEWNPKVWPFKGKLLSSTFLWYCLLCCTKWF